jgi:hypothetical protein
VERHPFKKIRATPNKSEAAVLKMVLYDEGVGRGDEGHFSCAARARALIGD